MDQRIRDIESILRVMGAARVAEAQLTEEQYDPAAHLRWLRALSDATLSAYRLWLENEAGTVRTGNAGSGGMLPEDMVLAAADHGCDDTDSALLLFVLTRAGVMPSTVLLFTQGKRHNSHLYLTADERLRELQALLLSPKRALLPDGIAAVLLHGNILTADRRTQDGIAALIRVADALEAVGKGRSHWARRDAYFQRSDALIRSEELLRLVVDRAGDTDRIVEIIGERKTDDPGVILGVLDAENAALSSGML